MMQYLNKIGIQSTNRKDEMNMADYISCEQTFSECLFENGFHGALWVCFEKFLGAEYRDREYMRSLLTDNEYIVYLDDNNLLNFCLRLKDFIWRIKNE